MEHQQPSYDYVKGVKKTQTFFFCIFDSFCTTNYSQQNFCTPDLEAQQPVVGPPGALQLCAEPHIPPSLLPHHPHRQPRGGAHHVSGQRLHCPPGQPPRHLEPGWHPPGEICGHLPPSQVTCSVKEILCWSHQDNIS